MGESNKPKRQQSAKSGQERRSWNMNQNLAVNLKLRLHIIHNDRQRRSTILQQEIKDLREEVKWRVHEVTKSSSRNLYQRKQNEIFNSRPATAACNQEKFSKLKLDTNKRPVSAPVSTSAYRPRSCNNLRFRSCYACSRGKAFRQAIAQPTARPTTAVSFKPTATQFYLAPPVVVQTWMNRERYLSKHLD